MSMAKASSLDLQRLVPARLAALWRGEGLLHWRLFQPRYPPLAVEVGTNHLCLVHVDRGKDKKPVVRRYSEVEVPEGALEMRFGQRNIRRPAEVAAALLGALEKEGIESRALSIVLPDHLARTALLHLGERPGRRAEVLEVIRWKLRKAVPFKVEDAHIDYQMFPAPKDGGAHLCQAVLVLRSVLESYESLMKELGLHAGLLDLSSFNLVNLYRPVLEEEPGDSFLLNVSGSFFAMLVLRDGVPIFYRAKSYTFANGDRSDPQRAMVVREVDSSLTYYRERLGGVGPVRIHMRCVDLGADALREALEGRIDGQVVPLDVTRIIPVEPRSDDPVAHQEMLQRIAPALGAALGRDG
jgi:type IV pilus assembly protein PilM